MNKKNSKLMRADKDFVDIAKKLSSSYNKSIIKITSDLSIFLKNASREVDK